MARGWAGASGAEFDVRRKGRFSLGPWEDSLEWDGDRDTETQKVG